MAVDNQRDYKNGVNGRGLDQDTMDVLRKVLTADEQRYLSQIISAAAKLASDVNFRVDGVKGHDYPELLARGIDANHLLNDFCCGGHISALAQLGL